MQAAYDEFALGARALRAYITGLQLEWQLLAATSASPPCSASDELAATLRTHVGSGVGKRRFDYNSVIISMYGLIEQLLEAIVRGYSLQLHSLTKTFAELPPAFQKAHTELSVALLAKLDHSRYRGVTSAQQVTACLHSCLSGQTPYALNVEALYQHSANFRSDVVNSTLARLGVVGMLERLPLFPPMSDYLASQHPDRDLATIGVEEIYGPLDDLAERRNEVAHGTPSALLSNDILLDYLTFCEAFASALHSLMYSEAIAFEVSRRGLSLGKPVAVFNHSIICVELNDQAIRLGDVLAVETGRSAFPYLGGPIAEIQVDKAPVDEVVAQPSIRVGCKVPFRAKESYTVFLLPREDATEA